MRVTFWGVRGSIPSPGAFTTRWGGNTSCVEVRVGDDPPLVLDCGTGARALGTALVREHVRHVRVLFSHLHADHLFGLPFFAPMYTPGAVIELGVPAWNDDEARERLARWLNGTFHPVRLRDIPAELRIFAVRPDRPLPVPGVSVARLNHPGGALGYRIDADGRSFAHLTDTGPFARPGEGLMAGEAPTPQEERMIAFLRGCDVVSFDTMYDLDEYLERLTWGHSYPEYAAAICRAAGVERLVLFHHAPDHHDEVLDARAARFADHVQPRISLAREGETITL